MANHDHRCDQCADLLSVILNDCKADYISQSALSRIFEVCPPCVPCQEKLYSMQSRLTGRIYLQQLSEYWTELQADFYNNVEDLFKH